jgi:hypothetical protein
MSADHPVSRRKPGALDLLVSAIAGAGAGIILALVWDLPPWPWLAVCSGVGVALTLRSRD